MIGSLLLLQVGGILSASLLTTSIYYYYRAATVINVGPNATRFLQFVLCRTISLSYADNIDI